MDRLERRMLSKAWELLEDWRRDSPASRGWRIDETELVDDWSVAFTVELYEENDGIESAGMPSPHPAYFLAAAIACLDGVHHPVPDKTRELMTQNQPRPTGAKRQDIPYGKTQIT